MPETVQVTEIIWLISAVPGLVLWSQNFVVARQVSKYVPAPNGRLIWAQFSVWLTITFVLIECGFVGVGLLAMTTAPADTSPFWLRILFASIFTSISGGISLLGFRWKWVDNRLMELARKQTR